MEDAPKQMMSLSWNAGSWRVIVDGEEVGVFEGSWSGEVSTSLKVERVQ